MGNAIVTFKIMPESPETDIESVESAAIKVVTEAGCKGESKTQVEPLAFGLKQIKLLSMFEVKDDNDFEGIAEKLAEIEGVQSAEMLSADLAMG